MKVEFYVYNKIGYFMEEKPFSKYNEAELYISNKIYYEKFPQDELLIIPRIKEKK